MKDDIVWAHTLPGTGAETQDKRKRQRQGWKIATKTRRCEPIRTLLTRRRHERDSDRESDRESSLTFTHLPPGLNTRIRPRITSSLVLNAFILIFRYFLKLPLPLFNEKCNHYFCEEGRPAPQSRVRNFQKFTMTKQLIFNLS